MLQQLAVMYDLSMFRRALLHPKFSFSRRKLVTWGSLSLNLKVVPSIFVQCANFSGKARVKPQAEVPEDVKHQAQQVLQDYLYQTREFNICDARDISLNAPCFIHKLVSSVRRQKNLTRSLTKHLLYNPINEFEPFFESIGIKPCDIHSLLPRFQLFMKENEVLLAVVSILRNIGFPRQELGKLYKDHPNIFNCTSKELQNKLQFYENLGVSKASLVRIISTCPSVLNDDLYRNFMVVIIVLNGFQLEKSRNSCLLERNLHNRGIILENLMLLVGVGCSWDEIRKIFHTKSDLLNNGSEESLCSIIEFLSSLGIQKENICSFVITCPEILNPELVKSMEIGAASVGVYQEAREKIDFYRGKLIKLLECTVGMVFEKQKFSAFVKKHLKNMKPLTLLCKDDPENIHIMFSDGVDVHYKASSENGVDVGNKASPEKFQSTMMDGGDSANRKKDLVVDNFQQEHSSSVQELQICENLKSLISVHKLNIFLKVGLAKNFKKVTKVARTIQCTSNKLQERFNYLLGLGLPFCALCKIFWAMPNIFSHSLYSLQKKVDYLLSSVSNPLQVLESFPFYLTLSLEHRIIPRYKLYQWLRENNVLKSEISISSIISPSAKIFDKKYVMLHPEGRNYFRKCLLTYERASSAQQNQFSLLDGVDVVEKTSPENLQSSIMEGGDLANKKKDLVFDSFPQKHSATVQDIQMCEHLHRWIPRHTLNIFLKVGLAKSFKKMNEAASRIECTSDKLQERFNYLLGLGLPFCAVCKILWLSPSVFSQSLNSLRKKADFLRRSVSNPLQFLESFPLYLTLSLERRIIPRYKLYQWLRENNVLKSELSVSSIFFPSEKIFDKKYVMLHPKGRNYFRQCLLAYEHASSTQENQFSLLDGVDVVEKASSENLQSLMMEGRDLANRKKDLVVDSFPQKHSATIQEIQICEHLHRQIPRHTLTVFLKVGLAKSSKKMNEAASRIHCTSDKLQERFNYLIGLGLPFCAVCKILWSYPTAFSQSLNSLQKKTDFLFRSVSNPLQALESYPTYWTYSLERRIMPRYKFYKWLRTNNVLKSEVVIMSIIRLSEKSFEKKYVKLHPKGSNYFRQCKLHLLKKHEGLKSMKG